MDRFTPEYSGELLMRIQNIYAEEIRPEFPQLKLKRLLDLSESAELLLEEYTEKVESDPSVALRVFIIGLFYLYLVIPESMQFHTRDKSYGLYTDLRHMYELQLNMVNVVAMVKDEIAKIQERDDQQKLEKFESGVGRLQANRRLVTKRSAYSIPTTVNNMSKLSLHDDEDTKRSTDSNKNGGHHVLADLVLDKTESRTKSNPITSTNSHHGATHYLNGNAVDFDLGDDDDTEGYVTDSSNDEGGDGAGSPIWQAPELEPDDQLKLALGTELLSPPIMGLDGDSIGDSVSDTFVPEECDDIGGFDDLHANRLLTHRKDSYHSVYMIEDENMDFKNYFDDSNGFIQGLERLQKQSIITAPELFSILSNEEERKKLLLIDLRMKKRSDLNHIEAPTVVNIDPTLLWDEEAKTPIYQDTILENLLQNENFNNRLEFDYIVYYTDMKTYMHTEYDYSFILFYLLTTSNSKHLTSVPTALLGGYEKWKKVITTYVDQYQIDADDYLFRPYGKEPPKTTNNNQPIMEPPTWKPPPVPTRVRKRPPPPPPASIPVPPASAPPIPPKLKLESIEESKPMGTVQRYNRPLAPLPRRVTKPQHMAPLSRKYSIPTIEKNSNPYVAYSITGLRNLGNTCYINSMVQSLFATKKLRDLFISGKYKEYQTHPQDNRESIMSNSFAVLFNKMYMNGGCTVVPSGFLKVSNLLRPDLRIPDDQQDTQEFLLFVLNRLHDELANQSTVVNDYSELMLYDDEKLMVDKTKYKKWYESTVINSGLSPIDSIFQGQMENTLHCQRCGYQSSNYSTFYVLSLALPKPSTPTFSRTGRVKLENCINMFTSDEVLTGENAWDCPKCGSATDDVRYNNDGTIQQTPGHHHHHKMSKFFGLPTGKAISRSKSPFRKLGLLDKHENKHETKQEKAERDERDDLLKLKSKKLYSIKTLNFITLPPVLIIHLSRFYYDLTKKNDTVVSYPLVLNIVLKNEEVVKYKLYSIVNHTGNLISGHYTSLVNKDPQHNLGVDDQKWFYFDDEVVKAEKSHGNYDRGVLKVSSKNVYVLFYERVV
ncbi:Uncharacterized protein RNJ44_04458 [Nakaseomyces bracarensis]|uniref:ubiquitinyl hydrolase 1 n=1 Tax=Nakaseomyces bracarensis TaxID=273131 RepID=A0ABR4NV04_9SACH